MFLNIHIDLIILNKYDQHFILTTKKSLHIIFTAVIELHSTNVSVCQFIWKIVQYWALMNGSSVVCSENVIQARCHCGSQHNRTVQLCDLLFF